MSIYLVCPYPQKHIAKQNGAKWDAAQKQWFYPGDELPEPLKQFLPSAQPVSGWGKHGTRYDEDCARCGRCAEIDNDTELCQRCGSKPAIQLVDTTASNPYRRGIGQGFGSTDDGQEVL